MNYFIARVRHGDAKAVRRFIMTARRSKTAKEAWERLGISRALFFKVRLELENKGHTIR